MPDLKVTLFWESKQEPTLGSIESKGCTTDGQWLVRLPTAEHGQREERLVALCSVLVDRKRTAIVFVFTSHSGRL